LVGGGGGRPVAFFPPAVGPCFLPMDAAAFRASQLAAPTAVGAPLAAPGVGGAIRVGTARRVVGAGSLAAGGGAAAAGDGGGGDPRFLCLTGGGAVDAAGAVVDAACVPSRAGEGGAAG
jgi:hypothetical protein